MERLFCYIGGLIYKFILKQHEFIYYKVKQQVSIQQIFLKKKST
jgi:hypothetical protein